MLMRMRFVNLGFQAILTRRRTRLRGLDDDRPFFGLPPLEDRILENFDRIVKASRERLDRRHGIDLRLVDQLSQESRLGQDFHVEEVGRRLQRDRR